MKFFVSVFLLIMSSDSFVKIVLGIKCHQTENPDEDHCLQELQRSGRWRPKELSSLFVCFRNASDSSKDQKELCDASVNAACYTLTYELADQTQHMIKHCDDSEHSHCPHAKETFDAEFLFGRFVKSSRCDFCSSDNCNDQKPRDKPSVPESPSPPKMAAGLKCHITTGGAECGKTNRSPSEVLDCLRNAPKEDKIQPCPFAMAACTKTRIKLENGEQLELKGCIGPETPDCEEIRIMNTWAFQTEAECESCDTNLCNGETPSAEKHSREIHSGRSQSLATSTEPIAFGILIFNLLVHFLL